MQKQDDMDSSSTPSAAYHYDPGMSSPEQHVTSAAGHCSAPSQTPVCSHVPWLLQLHPPLPASEPSAHPLPATGHRKAAEERVHLASLAMCRNYAANKQS